MNKCHNILVKINYWAVNTENYARYRNLPSKRPPVKASIYARDILAFTGMGALAREITVFETYRNNHKNSGGCKL